MRRGLGVVIALVAGVALSSRDPVVAPAGEATAEEAAVHRRPRRPDDALRVVPPTANAITAETHDRNMELAREEARARLLVMVADRGLDPAEVREALDELDRR